VFPQNLPNAERKFFPQMGAKCLPFTGEFLKVGFFFGKSLIRETKLTHHQEWSPEILGKSIALFQEPFSNRPIWRPPMTRNERRQSAFHRRQLPGFLVP